MQLGTRVEGGGTARLTRWGIDSEYGRLREVLIGPIDHFSWQPESNAVSQRAARVGLRFDAAVARRQYQEMIAAYEEAGVHVHTLPAQKELPYQIFARDSNAGKALPRIRRREPLQASAEGDLPTMRYRTS